MRRMMGPGNSAPERRGAEFGFAVMSIDVERSADPVRVRSRGGNDGNGVAIDGLARHQEEQWVVRIGHDVEANRCPVFSLPRG